VERLSRGEHPVWLSLHPDATTMALKECLKRGYVYVRFTNTKGGTELGVSLDKTDTRVSASDLENRSGDLRAPPLWSEYRQ